MNAYQRTVRSGRPKERALRTKSPRSTPIMVLRVSCRIGGQAVIASTIAGRARCCSADQNVSHWPAIRASTTVIPVTRGGGIALMSSSPTGLGATCQTE